MTTYQHYDQVYSQYSLRMDRDKMRGGDYRAFVAIHEKLWATHQPPESRVGEPCNECSEPWPCGIVMSVIHGWD